MIERLNVIGRRAKRQCGCDAERIGIGDPRERRFGVSRGYGGIRARIEWSNEFTDKLFPVSARSDAKYAVSAITATGFLREGHRRLDVLLQRLRLSIADGVRGGEQLHGSRGHQSHEGILGRGSQGGHRRIQGMIRLEVGGSRKLLNVH